MTFILKYNNPFKCSQELQKLSIILLKPPIVHIILPTYWRLVKQIFSTPLDVHHYSPFPRQHNLKMHCQYFTYLLKIIQAGINLSDSLTLCIVPFVSSVVCNQLWYLPMNVGCLHPGVLEFSPRTAHGRGWRSAAPREPPSESWRCVYLCYWAVVEDPTL